MAGSLAAVLAVQLAFVAVRPAIRPLGAAQLSRHAAQFSRLRPPLLAADDDAAAADDDALRPPGATAGVVTDRQLLLETRAGWTLLFNAGSENEGIYSRLGADGVNLVLLFEVEEDAGRYIDMLEAQDFPSARAVEIETADLLAFCDEGGHALGLVPADAVVVPPEATVDTFDWKVGESTEAAEELEGATRDEVDEWRAALQKNFNLDSDS